MIYTACSHPAMGLWIPASSYIKIFVFKVVCIYENISSVCPLTFPVPQNTPFFITPLLVSFSFVQASPLLSTKKPWTDVLIIPQSNLLFHFKVLYSPCLGYNEVVWLRKTSNLCLFINDLLPIRTTKQQSVFKFSAINILIFFVETEVDFLLPYFKKVVVIILF